MKKIILPISVVICVVAVACMLLALTTHKPSNNEFTPPAFDSAAQIGAPNVSDEIQGYSELDAKAFKVSVCGKLTANDGKVDLYLTNPDSNTVWLKVRLLDESGNILGETGLVKPGEYVKTLKLDDIPKQTKTVKLKIMAYEPDTYYSAGAANLNTTLEIE